MKTWDAVPKIVQLNEELDVTPLTPAWFLDGSHSTPPFTPMYSWFWAHPSSGIGAGMQWVADKITMPWHKGCLFKMIGGSDYLSPSIIKDEEEVKMREAKFKEALRPYIEDFNGLWAGYRDELLEKYKPLKEANLDAMSNVELKEQFRLITEAHRRMWEIHWLMLYVAATCWGVFQDTCFSMFGIDQESPLFQDATRGFDNKAFQMDRRQWEFAQDVKKRGLTDIFTGPASGVIPKLEQSKNGKEWLKEFNEFLQEDGWRAGRECEINGPTWIEDPTMPIENIQNFLKIKKEGFQLDAMRSELQRKRQEAQETLLKKVPVEERDFFKVMMNVAGQTGAFSEEHGYYCEYYINALIRRICLAIGKRFVKAGALDHVDDIMFLNGDEVNFCSPSPEFHDVRSIVKFRKKEWEESCKEERKRPISIGKLGPQEGMGYLMSAKDSTIIDIAIGRMPKPKPELKADLYGIPVSAGVVEGPARCVSDFRELAEVQPGEILVCPAAQPSWTSVFSLLKGVVSAHGGTLHHASVIAREFGIPAVSNVFDGIGKIKTGQRIRVDGTQGVVYFLDK